MLCLCNIFQWSHMSFPVSLSLSLLQTLIHTRTHTLWLTSACFASVSVSISTLPPHRLSLFLYLSLLQCLCRLDHVFTRKKKTISQSETTTHPPSLCKLSFSQSPSISLFYSDSLPQTGYRCNYTRGHRAFVFCHWICSGSFLRCLSGDVVNNQVTGWEMQYKKIQYKLCRWKADS